MVLLQINMHLTEVAEGCSKFINQTIITLFIAIFPSVQQADGSNHTTLNVEALLNVVVYP